MPQRSAQTRRVAPSVDDRISFELPSHDDVEAVTTGLATRLALTGISTAAAAATVDQTPPLAEHASTPHVNHAKSEFEQWLEQFPNAVQCFGEIEAQHLRGKKLALFLDYDGTLTPIVSNPDRAFLSDEMRRTVRELAEVCPTAIISGRGLEKVQNFVRLDSLYYAGSHGLDIRAPSSSSGSQDDWRCDRSNNDVCLQPAAELKPLMNHLYETLRQAVKHIHGAQVEHNTFCLSVHFRNCHEESWDEIKAIVKKTVADHEPLLKSARGRKVLDVRPRLEWGKGKAVEHFLKAWSCEGGNVVPVYVGDDRTDEDAFQFLRKREGTGIGILVSSKMKPSEAHYSVNDPSEVLQFLRKLNAWARSQQQQSHHA